MTFGERLREAREKAGISGPDAAKEVGVSRNYIYDLEKEIKKPSLELVAKLSQLYRDKALIKEFLQQNRIFDDEFDFTYEIFEKIPYESLKRRMSYVQRIYAVIDNNEEARNEIVDFLENFLAKYEKPDADK